MKIIILSIYLIAGPYGLSKDQAASVYAATRAVYASELGIDLRLRRLRNKTDLFPGLYTLASQYDHYYAWKAWLISKGRLPSKAKRIFYVMVPPMREGSIRYIGGLSEICHKSHLTSISLGSGEQYNQDGAYRMGHTSVIMQHEVGHQLCATHDDSLPATIMHSNALPYVPALPQILHFSDKSKAEIRNY